MPVTEPQIFPLQNIWSTTELCPLPQRYSRCFHMFGSSPGELRKMPRIPFLSILIYICICSELDGNNISKDIKLNLILMTDPFSFPNSRIVFVSAGWFLKTDLLLFWRRPETCGIRVTGVISELISNRNMMECGIKNIPNIVFIALLFCYSGQLWSFILGNKID